MFGWSADTWLPQAATSHTKRTHGEEMDVRWPIKLIAKWFPLLIELLNFAFRQRRIVDR